MICRFFSPFGSQAGALSVANSPRPPSRAEQQQPAAQSTVAKRLRASEPPVLASPLPIPNPPLLGFRLRPPSPGRLHRRRGAAPSPGLDLPRNRRLWPCPSCSCFYPAGDPPRVAFLLSVNPRRGCSRSPLVFAAKNRIFRPGTRPLLARGRCWESMESVRFFSADARVGGVEWGIFSGRCWHVVPCWGSGSF